MGIVIGLLGVLFVGLKLTDHIDWHWAWVTLPFWGGFAFIITMSIIFGFISVLSSRREILDSHKEIKERFNKFYKK